MPDGSEPESPAAWLAAVEARMDEEEAVWLAGYQAVQEQDCDGRFVFAGPPWLVWLEAKAAGASSRELAILGHRPFRMGYELDCKWTELSVTLAALICSPQLEAITGPVADTTIGGAIKRIAGKGVLLWDPEAQMSSFGPQTLQAWSAEAVENHRSARLEPASDPAARVVTDRRHVAPG